MGECVRIYLARLTKEEHNARHQYTAMLRNIPQNVQLSNFMRLYSNTAAMALELPRTINNYLKPWIYINFKSEEIMQVAMEITSVLNSSSLIWDTPDNVNRFCSRCSSSEHKAKDCDNSKSRGRKPTPKALLNVYKKHSIVNAATKRADK